MRVIIAFLLLMTWAAAAACETNLVGNDLQQEIATYTGIAFAFVFLIISLAYMAGMTTNNANLLIFAKDEIFHLIISLVLVISIGAILYFSCTVISAFLDFALESLIEGPSTCYSSGQDPMVVARCYITNLESAAKTTLTATVKDSIKKEMDSATVFGLYNPVTGGIMTPTNAHLKVYSMQLDMVGLTFLLPSLVSLSIQKAFLTFVTDLIKYLIPTALFLRVLPGTRPMGNMLIAVVIALYVFVPSLYALNAAMDEIVFQGSTMGCASVEELINDRVMGDCNTSYNFWAVARFIPQAFFFPNLILAITITFLSAINKALKVLT